MFAELYAAVSLLAELDPCRSPVAALLTACLLGGVVLGGAGVGGGRSVQARDTSGPVKPTTARDDVAVGLFMLLALTCTFVGLYLW